MRLIWSEGMKACPELPTAHLTLTLSSQASTRHQDVSGASVADAQLCPMIYNIYKIYPSFFYFCGLSACSRGSETSACQKAAVWALTDLLDRFVFVLFRIIVCALSKDILTRPMREVTCQPRLFKQKKISVRPTRSKFRRFLKSNLVYMGSLKANLEARNVPAHGTRQVEVAGGGISQLPLCLGRLEGQQLVRHSKTVVETAKRGWKRLFVGEISS